MIHGYRTCLLYVNQLSPYTLPKKQILMSFETMETQYLRAFIHSVASLTHTDNMETVDEIHRMIVELDDEMNAMQEMLAGGWIRRFIPIGDFIQLQILDRRNLVSERMAFEEEFRDSHLNLRHAIDPFEVRAEH